MRIEKKEITHSGQPLIKKHRRKRVIKGKRIKNSVARKIMKTYGTDLVEERYDLILATINAFRTGCTKTDIIAQVGYSDNNITAHLRYGKETGMITSKKNKNQLRKFKIKNQAEYERRMSMCKVIMEADDKRPVFFECQLVILIFGI
jgi:Fic family protein